jgi:hypothetical protein
MSDLAPQKTYLYLLYNEIIYDPIQALYYNILTLNKNPEGLLKTYTKLTSLTKPSSRDLITTQCAFVITKDLLTANSNTNSNNLSYSNILTLDELNEFTEFLINNNYIITDYNNNNNNYNNYNNNNNNNNNKKIIYSFKITL